MKCDYVPQGRYFTKSEIALAKAIDPKYKYLTKSSPGTIILSVNKPEYKVRIQRWIYGKDMLAINTRAFTFDGTRPFKNMSFTELIYLDEVRNAKPGPWLDEVEKRYIKNIVRPFEKDIYWIEKCVALDGINEVGHRYYYISIAYKDEIQDDGVCILSFPSFRDDKGMYDGMEVNVRYTLEGLDLV